MRNRRFFVTYVVILGLLAILADSAASLLRASRSHSPSALAQTGNEKLQESQSVRVELQAQYGIDVESVKNAHQFNWKVLTKDQRRDIQAKLATFLSLVNQVLVIDAQKNITIDHRGLLLQARDSAEAFQKAIETFEQVYGENYRPDRRLVNNG